MLATISIQAIRHRLGLLSALAVCTLAAACATVLKRPDNAQRPAYRADGTESVARIDLNARP